jgi:hypothetical protein
MMTCIYCSRTDFTPEHHLPRCLGNFKGYVQLGNTICSECNRAFGKLDEQLCRSGSEAFFRKFLGIEGRKKHDSVNSFYRGSSGGGPLEMVGLNHATGQKAELELVGPGNVRELRCVKFVADDDSQHIIRITDGMTPAEFKQRVDALGFKSFKHASISATAEEIPWVESLFEGFKFEKKTEWIQPTGPILYGPFDIKITVTSKYFREMAKIAFHYFLTKFPRFRGNEECFSQIRDFIRNGTIDDIPRFVTQCRKQFIHQLRSGDRLSAWGHFVTAESNYFDFKGKVQLFVGPENRSTVFTVNLGQNPSPIHYSEGYGDFFAYYPPEERGEFDGEVSALGAVTPR